MTQLLFREIIFTDEHHLQYVLNINAFARSKKIAYVYKVTPQWSLDFLNKAVLACPFLMFVIQTASNFTRGILTNVFYPT